MMQPCPNTLKKDKNIMKKYYDRHVLGWLGAILVLYGYYLNANMDANSWIVWIVGNSCIGLYSLNKEAYPTAVMSLVLVLLNVYGYLNWT